MKQHIAKIFRRLNKLDKCVSCCNGGKCPTCPEYRSANVDFFNTEGDPDWGNPYINLNDRFPLPACAGQKGILFLNDATLYCRFAYEYNPEDPNSGWVIDDYQRGGRNR